MRRAIETAWGCRVFEHYGSTELGLGGAVQCEAFAGLHVREADLLFEVIHPDTGEALPDGVEGELVATTLTRQGMPLIRYRTGDLVRMSANRCRCGSALRCLERVTGRRDEAVLLPGDGVLTIADLDEVLYHHDSVLGFTAVLDQGPAGERLAIRIEAGDEAPLDLATELTRRLEVLPALAKGAVEIAVETAGTPPIISGAAKQRIVDSRGAA
jgi:phenylacetate-coenzyme A ligase PaaK-like adenylate-forming protein